MAHGADRVQLHQAADSGVATVTMVGGAENYLTVFLLRDLADALETAAADPGCGAVVVRSAGKHFCAGRDWRTARVPEDTAEAIYNFVQRLAGASKPWVAELTGAAIGVGMGVAMCADYRIAATSAYLWPKFVSIGIHHGFGLTATLPATVGGQRATELLSTGRKISMPEALRIGLVDDVAPLDAVETTAQEFAATLAAQPRHALAAIRQTMREPLIDSLGGAITRERTAQEALYESSDFQAATDGGYRYER